MEANDQNNKNDKTDPSPTEKTGVPVNNLATLRLRLLHQHQARRDQQSKEKNLQENPSE
eukprot:Pgem_evm1s19273